LIKRTSITVSKQQSVELVFRNISVAWHTIRLFNKRYKDLIALNDRKVLFSEREPSVLSENSKGTFPMTKKLMNKSKLVAWLSVLGVLAVTAIALFAAARSAAHAATSAPNRINMTSVTANNKGQAQGDITYTCQPNSPVINVTLFVSDHDAGIANGKNISPTCDGKVHKTTIFILGKDGKFYSLGDHVTATAALTDHTNTAVESAAFDKEDVTL
jgi:hypothetical protein